MTEHSQQRPDIEPRRASASVADTWTQTEEEQAPEQHIASLARTKSLDRNKQLAPRRSAQDDQVIRRRGEAVAQHHDDRGGAPAVRLDMDLDIDIKMQAKIKGEIELSIL
ncbi:hypothetical protein C8A01DRAFT_16383 [Parachaetomium inaequale]|uniref:Uncharacterized protein n=1 Tax=Parachaetomium inaequale TaxID=2588326 RepID=A0AAN6PER8_9PEZI|nr:hypothetical protein C8A01DRAFT_16383 [Parachaetomium inaequale]